MTAGSGSDGCRYKGTSSACARSKIGQNRLSSTKTPLASPWIIAPLKPSLVVRSSSSAAAFGSLVGSAAKAANRVGLAATTAWRRSLTRRVTSIASAPESFCAEGAPWDRICLVHFLEAHFAEVVEALEHFRIAYAFGADEE